jgi:hypothetical protein
MGITSGQRLTLLKIDDSMALTHRYELQVVAALPETKVGYEGRKTRLATVKQRGKRREQYLDLARDDILLAGWDLPFKTDTECSGVFAGNACYNLVGDPAAIRSCIEEKAVYPVTESAKAKILVSTAPRTTCDDSGIVLLYPNIETHHAVINRIKAEQAEQLSPVFAPIGAKGLP